MARKMKIRGAKDIAKIDKTFDRIDKGLNDSKRQANLALYAQAESVLEKSNEYAPKDTEALIESGQVAERTSTKNVLRLAVIYTVDYAGVVHENTEMNHPALGPNKRNPARFAPEPSGTLGQAKFLERAWKEQLPQMSKDISESAFAAIRNATKGG